jgi:tripartite-type tricarboxylate transporter receptor subunit TctC
MDHMRKRPAGGRGLLAALLCGALSFTLAPARAQDFYTGKQISMLVGSGTGGGYDAYARLFGRHLHKHIPGAPTVVVQNVPAAGSLVAMNTLANSAPRDGTTIGAVQTHIGVEPLMGVTGPTSNAKYDARQMNWLFSAAKEVPVVVAWHTAPIKSFADLTTREMLVGSSGVATSDAVYPRVMNTLLDTKFKIIDGYKDNPQLLMATEGGEIMGRAGWFVSSLLSTQSAEVEQGKQRVIVQVALEKHARFPNVPLVAEFLKDPVKLEQLRFALSWLPMGRPFVAPPGVPPERLKILRDAFEKAAKDPELLAEAARMNLEISPLTGQEVQDLIAKLYATPPSVVEKVRDIMVVK